jgi:hypothetical protein
MKILDHNEVHIFYIIPIFCVEPISFKIAIRIKNLGPFNLCVELMFYCSYGNETTHASQRNLVPTLDTKCNAHGDGRTGRTFSIMSLC